MISEYAALMVRSQASVQKMQDPFQLSTVNPEWMTWVKSGKRFQYGEGGDAGCLDHVAV